MKICWDNLEKIYYKNGNFYNKTGNILLYFNSCSVCGEPFLALKHHSGLYCSKACKSRKQMLGTKRTEETKRRISIHRRGKLTGDENPMCRPELQKYFSKLYSGSNNPNWQGGKKVITCTVCGKFTTNKKYCSPQCCYEDRRYDNKEDYVALRCSFEYKQWRKAVFERDNYTCQLCNKRDGKFLHAHHIKRVADNPELIFDINNGITLHETCHRKITGEEKLYEEEFKNCITR